MNVPIHNILGKDVPEPEQSPVYIFYDGEPTEMVDCGSFPVYVDGKEVCDCPNFTTAAVIFIASFPIFHLEYTEAIQPAMLLFEQLLIKLPPNQQKVRSKKRKTIESKILRVLSKLDKV